VARSRTKRDRRSAVLADPVAVGMATVSGWGIQGERLARRLFNRVDRRDVADWPADMQLRCRETGSGSPLVLLNGFSAGGLLWPEGWLRSLERRFRVLRVDIRGSGQRASPFTIADAADDVAAVLDVCGHRRATVLGISMGGMVAQELGLRHPQRVARLFLVATIPPAPAHVPAVDYGSLLGAALVRRGQPSPPGLLGLMTRVYLATAGRNFSPSAQVVEEMSDQLRSDPTALSQVLLQARAIIAWKSPSRLRRMRVPTTVIQGGDDRVVRPVNGRRLAALIPGARYVELPGVGHLVPWEAPDQLLRALSRGMPEAAR
jgi:3-oxoadipate enol-lactonase